jgi:hypothetical protein
LNENPNSKKKKVKIQEGFAKENQETFLKNQYEIKKEGIQFKMKTT